MFSPDDKLYGGYVKIYLKTNLLQKSKRHFCVVFQSSSTGKPRLELYPSHDDADRGTNMTKVYSLAQCCLCKVIYPVKASAAILIMLDEHKQLQMTPELESDLQPLRQAISSAAFDKLSGTQRDVKTSNTIDEEDEYAYSIPWDLKNVNVIILETNESRNRNLHGEYEIMCGIDAMSLKAGHVVAASWLYRDISRIGIGETNLMITVGARSIFEFVSENAKRLIDILRYRVNVRPISRMGPEVTQQYLQKYTSFYHITKREANEPPQLEGTGIAGTRTSIVSNQSFGIYSDIANVSLRQGYGNPGPYFDGGNQRANQHQSSPDAYENRRSQFADHSMTQSNAAAVNSDDKESRWKGIKNMFHRESVKHAKQKQPQVYEHIKPDPLDMEAGFNGSARRSPGYGPGATEAHIPTYETIAPPQSRMAKVRVVNKLQPLPPVPISEDQKSEAAEEVEGSTDYEAIFYQEPKRIAPKPASSEAVIKRNSAPHTTDHNIARRSSSRNPYMLPDEPYSYDVMPNTENEAGRFIPKTTSSISVGVKKPHAPPKPKSLTSNKINPASVVVTQGSNASRSGNIKVLPINDHRSRPSASTKVKRDFQAGCQTDV